MTCTRLLVLLAGLIGAAGVALAALGSHAYAGTNLPVAATMASLQAPAILALAIGRKTGLLHDLLARIAAWALIIGTVLFAGDIAAKALLGQGFFPMAAPTGGSTLILGWLAAAASGLLAPRRTA